MPEYAAYLLNRLHKGHDGMVAYERVKGKIPSVLGVEFGEKVRYRNRVITKAKKSGKLEKLNSRWSPGIVVGVKRFSNEIMVSVADEVLFVRSVRRIPVEHRWGQDCVSWVN